MHEGVIDKLNRLDEISDSSGKYWAILRLAKDALSEEHYDELHFELYMLDEAGYNDVYRHGRAMFLEMLADEEYDRGEIK
jgi:hypothetical protein